MSKEELIAEYEAQIADRWTEIHELEDQIEDRKEIIDNLIDRIGRLNVSN